MNLADIRRDYTRAALTEQGTADDPMVQLRSWLDEASQAGVAEVNAMTLATADATGQPSARIVLLKGIGPDGMHFFTDYRSRKGQELAENPRAALVMHWPELERQVRVVGTVDRLDAAASFAYFRSRPEGSRIGAWASHQSAVLVDRADLERDVARIAAEYAGREIPLPPHWGGFAVLPHEVEFWQGRPSRLHDRIQYSRHGNTEWNRVRLSP